MTKHERGLKDLVLDIHKAAKKQPHAKLWFPRRYPDDSYFVCDTARILKCSYFSELPLPSSDDLYGFEEFDYDSLLTRNLGTNNWVRVRLPSLDELNETKLLLRKIKEKEGTDFDTLANRQIRYYFKKPLWHFGGPRNYYRSDWIKKAIQAMKEPEAFINPNRSVCKWSFLYIRSKSEGTELLILPFDADQFCVNPFWRTSKLEVYKA